MPKCPCEQCETTINHTLDLLDIEEKKTKQLTEDLKHLKGAEIELNKMQVVQRHTMGQLIKHGTIAINYMDERKIMHCMVVTVAAKTMSQHMPATPLLPYPASQNN